MTALLSTAVIANRPPHATGATAKRPTPPTKPACVPRMAFQTPWIIDAGRGRLFTQQGQERKALRLDANELRIIYGSCAQQNRCKLEEGVTGTRVQGILSAVRLLY